MNKRAKCISCESTLIDEMEFDNHMCEKCMQYEMNNQALAGAMGDF